MANSVFEEKHREKLENPAMSLDDWLLTFHKHPVSLHLEAYDPSAEGAPKRRPLLAGLSSTRRQFRVRVQDPLWPNCQEATRSDADVTLLFKQLALRFPTAVLPAFHADVLNNPSLLEAHLQRLADNPFLRNDVAYCDFIDGLFKEYRMTKKKDRKLSQGMLRWLQCISEHPTVNSDDHFLAVLKQEFDQLEVNQKGLIKSLTTQVAALRAEEEAIDAISSAFESVLATERASEQKQPVSVCGLPPQRLGDVVQRTINMSRRHASALQRAYGSGAFQRVLIDPLDLELAYITSFRRMVSQVKAKKAQYESAKASLEKDGGSSSSVAQKAKLEEKKNEKYVEYHKFRQGVVGWELEQWRARRTKAFEEWYAEVSRFHLRGSSEVHKEWRDSGVRWDSSEDAAFFRRNINYAAASPSVGSAKKQKKMKHKSSIGQQQEVDTVSLLVTSNYSGGGRKYLKIREGEVLAAHKAENGDWQATNAKGKKGLVKATYVAVKAQAKQGPGLGGGSSFSAMMQRPPGLDGRTISNASSGTALTTREEEEEEEKDHATEVLEDWSLSEDDDDGGGDDDGGQGMARRKMLPSVIDETPIVLPTEARTEMTMTPEKHKSFVKFNSHPAPSAPPIAAFAPAASPPANGAPPIPAFTPAASLPANGAPPIPAASLPAKDASSMASSSAAGVVPMQKKSTFAGFGFGRKKAKKTMKGKSKQQSTFDATSREPPTALASSPPPPKSGLPPAAAVRPGPPLNFLADIKKGPGAVKLNKVPPPEKSKEIGGIKVHTPHRAAASSNASSSGAMMPTAAGGGGGGGLMGELNAKLNKRR